METNTVAQDEYQRDLEVIQRLESMWKEGRTSTEIGETLGVDMRAALRLIGYLRKLFGEHRFPKRCVRDTDLDRAAAECRATSVPPAWAYQRMER